MREIIVFILCGNHIEWAVTVAVEGSASVATPVKASLFRSCRTTKTIRGAMTVKVGYRCFGGKIALKRREGGHLRGDHENSCRHIRTAFGNSPCASSAGDTQMLQAAC